jgi:ferredoxin--NADP+ reductase
MAPTTDLEALRRAAYNGTVQSVRLVHDELMVLRVRPDAPIPPYQAGQWIGIGVGNWEEGIPGVAGECTEDERGKLGRRPFSISSPILNDAGTGLFPANEEDFYELYFGLARNAPRAGLLPSRLFALVPGARLWVDDRPGGANTLEPVQPGDDVLFLATGTGEAPHNRMIWELLRRNHRGRIASIVTTRLRVDQAYRHVHERAMTLFQNYKYAAIATREPDERGGRLQELLLDGTIEARAGFALSPDRVCVFLCGHPDMIGAPHLEDGRRVYPAEQGMIELLERERGYRAGDQDSRIRIHFERYG